jgi:hypothetical protein
MKGKGSVHLFVSSDRKDTDFAIRLTDVYPDNTSELVSDGILRMRFRNGFTATDTASMISGQVYVAVIDLPDLALTFLAGHKLRVDVTSSNYPRFDSNLNNGLTMYVAGDTVVASNKVFVSSDHASYIQLSLNGFFVNAKEIEADAKNIKVFPNPAKDFIDIVLPAEFNDDMKIVIADVCGKIVLSETMKIISSGDQNIQLSTGNLSAGVYSISLSGNNSTFTSKFIIEK